ncbi:unnamed protein product [Mycena citricolor]|uniref:BHLH domain-containing protein n=1 Tax=Mycena citricolor TaxID=2018698 RepID=A0AAD2HA10_9AGAR|nr:unnamed protein product [Mycena citricolor]
MTATPTNDDPFHERLRSRSPHCVPGAMPLGLGVVDEHEEFGYDVDAEVEAEIRRRREREALDAQFIDLARILPTLSHTHRLTKSLILTEAIAHTRKQRTQRLAAAAQIRGLLASQDALVKEVQALRAQLASSSPNSPAETDTALIEGEAAVPRSDSPPIPTSLPIALNPEAQQVLFVEQEVFSIFPPGTTLEDSDDLDERHGRVPYRDRNLSRPRRRISSRSISSVRTSHTRRSSQSPAPYAHSPRSADVAWGVSPQMQAAAFAHQPLMDTLIHDMDLLASLSPNADVLADYPGLFDAALSPMSEGSSQGSGDDDPLTSLRIHPGLRSSASYPGQQGIDLGLDFGSFGGAAVGGTPASLDTWYSRFQSQPSRPPLVNVGTHGGFI